MSGDLDPGNSGQARTVSLSPSPNPAIRHCTRLLSAVHELHKAGYQRIRISPGMSPSGLHWRCAITHKDNIAADGFRIVGEVRPGEVAFYTSADKTRYFGWPDAPGLSARQLAAHFIERFPIIAKLGAGQDWPYAGWLTDTLGRAERGHPGDLPVFFADYDLPSEPGRLPPP